MTRRYGWARPMGVAAILAVVGVMGAWILLGAKGNQPEFSSESKALPRQPTGYPQLVSVEPLPNEMCEWVPASAQTTLRAALRQERLAARAAAAEPATSVAVDRDPARVIRDTHPTYSAAIVDPIRNEIIAPDENLFQIMVFDRTANTPPAAGFTEPKRVIAGPSTTLEFECGIYVDPQTGDIYSLANDVGDRLAVFSREAKGDVPPNRVLHTPHGIYGIAVDEERQEMYLSVQGGSVVVYPKMAQRNDPPLRRLQGSRTRLGGVHGIAIDTKRNLMFVANHGNYGVQRDGSGGKFESSLITVFPLDASGDTPPLRVFQGPKTQLNWPALLFADAERGELYVANDGDHSVLVFRATEGGDVAPIRVIRGSLTGLRNPSSVYVDAKNNELVVSNLGNHSIVVFPRTANGDVAPLRTIRSAPQGKLALTIVNPGGVAYDGKRNEILAPN